jgi:hypothetical protein
MFRVLVRMLAQRSRAFDWKMIAEIEGRLQDILVVLRREVRLPQLSYVTVSGVEVCHLLLVVEVS